MQAIGSGGLSTWNIETVDASPEDKQNSGISEQTRILQHSRVRRVGFETSHTC